MRQLRYIFFRRPPRLRKPRRVNTQRNWRYRRWIRSLPSAVSGYYGCEAAHTGTDGGMSLKASDYSCIPLLPVEYREYHAIGRKAFERKHGISCAEMAKNLNRLWLGYSREAK